MTRRTRRGQFLFSLLIAAQVVEVAVGAIDQRSQRFHCEAMNTKPTKQSTNKQYCLRVLRVLRASL